MSPPCRGASLAGLGPAPGSQKGSGACLPCGSICMYQLYPVLEDALSTAQPRWAPHQQLGVLDDAEQLGPLAKAFLAQQEGADLGVFDQVHRGLLRRPLVPGFLPFSILLLFIVRLIGTAHSIRIIIYAGEKSRGERQTSQLTSRGHISNPCELQ